VFYIDMCNHTLSQDFRPPVFLSNFPSWALYSRTDVVLNKSVIKKLNGLEALFKMILTLVLGSYTVEDSLRVKPRAGNIVKLSFLT
jgi:hypothetical protein